MKWIDKNTLMPLNLEWPIGYVLVTDSKNIGIGRYEPDSTCWNYTMAGHIEADDNEITHWMPLPEPPK